MKCVLNQTWHSEICYICISLMLFTMLLLFYLILGKFHVFENFEVKEKVIDAAGLLGSSSGQYEILPQVLFCMFYYV